MTRDGLIEVLATAKQADDYMYHDMQCREDRSGNGESMTEDERELAARIDAVIEKAASMLNALFTP